jgi:hypothetical protein
MAPKVVGKKKDLASLILDQPFPELNKPIGIKSSVYHYSTALSAIGNR